MSLISRLMNLGRSRSLERDIDREMSFHIRERVEELTARGVPEHQALLEARRQFGNRTYQAEETRDADVVGWLDSVLGDLRYAGRALRRTPVFSFVAIASLAIGIGANSAIYSLIDAIVIRTLPVNQPEQLAFLSESPDGGGDWYTNPLWEQVRENSAEIGFASVAAYGGTSFNLSEGGEAREVRGEWVSGEYFKVFGASTAAGRLLSRSDDVRGCAGMVVLGHGFWQSEFGARPDVAGSVLSIDGKPFRIIGVVGPGFTSANVGYEPQLYAPICAESYLRGEQSSLDRRSHWWLQIIGRRQPGVELAEVRARLATLSPTIHANTLPGNWAAEHKAEYLKRTLSAVPAEKGQSGVRSEYTKPLYVLMAAVAVLLLIACANVANLLLARATSRQREVAIRLAMGAARRRIVRQLFTESLVMATLGAAAGLLLAHWGTQALVALISTADEPVILDLSLNERVLGFTAAVAVATALFFGLIPAWRGTRVSPQTAMKAAGRGVAEGHARFTFAKSLVVAQIALSLVLLVGAGLLVGSLRNLRGLDPGFRSEGVLIVSSDMGRAGFKPEQNGVVRRQILDRLRAIPGVVAASSADLTPIGRSAWNDEVHVTGFTPKNERDNIVWFNEVSPGYFQTLDIQLLAGRDFDDTDRPAGQRVAVVDETFARKFFGDRSPVGLQYRIRTGDSLSAPVTIVGVVERAKYRSLREEESSTIYITSNQVAEPRAWTKMQLRTLDIASVVPAVKRVFAETHPLITIEFSTLEGDVSASLQRERMLAVLSGIFGAVAVLLSMLGLYGVMAYAVARRRNEIGVRIALGADSSRVLRMILADVGRLLAIGVVVGVAIALAASKAVASLLYGMTPTEPAVLVIAVALIAAVALAAAIVPARRAARVDPVLALKED